MSSDQHPSPGATPASKAEPGTDLPSTHGPGQAEPPVPWAEFGQQVLAAHHRNGLGAQCACGSLIYHCQVIAAAERHGLPTDDPRGRPTASFTDSPAASSRQG